MSLICNCKKLAAALILVSTVFVLASCGLHANNSVSYAELEKIPHPLDKDYRAYNEEPLTLEESDYKSEPKVEVDIIVEEEEGEDHGIDQSEPVQKPNDNGDDTVADDSSSDEPDQNSNNPTPTDMTNTFLNHCVDDGEVVSQSILSKLNTNEVRAFEIALHISGSFEGKHKWENLTNNFDGQGVSLGLFQQNLGQGSLQPLMLKAISLDSDILNRHFTPSQVQLINEMLEDWANNKGAQFASQSLKALRSIASGWDHTANRARSARNSISVNWALDYLYVSNKPGKTFTAEWKKALKSFAGDPVFVKVQEDAAMKYHDRALNFMDTYQTESLISYLFFFDVVVQNGSMKGIQYTSSLAALNEDDRLQSLMKTRVGLSNKDAQSIVLERKSLILKGSGHVQSSQRSLSTETCITDWSTNITL